jgi:acyl-coenzyme A thioesterase PaaI-like protein
MSFNLIRNSRVFFTTNVGSSGSNLGVVAATGFTAANTREIQVLDGFGFSQNTTSETVTLNETGASPVRGQRSFNTQLDPVDFNMTTYIRPVDDGTIVTAEESVLWNALFGTAAISATPGTLASGAAWTNVATGTSPATCVATSSNAHQLQRFGLIVIIDTACFVIDDCVLNTATIDFGIDAIASIQWAGQAKAIRQITAPTFVDADTWSGSLAGDFKTKITTAAFIANKLSVVTLKENIGAAGTPPASGTIYNLPLTGGNLTISNNVSYLTPATLGIVNQPATYFAGTRAISGSMTAYLRTGSTETAGLLGTMLTNSSTDVDPAYYLKIAIGGSSATDRVELEMPGVVLTIPTIATEQVISTTINFTAQGTASNLFDLAQSNEINVKYYA